MNSDMLRVVLVSPRNPLNIGAAARAMSNFGFLKLRVVNAYQVAYDEAVSAVNASAVLKSSEQYETVADAIADCKLVVGTVTRGHRELQHSFQRLEYGAREMAAAGGPVALLFGSEKFGLGNEDMSYCHWLMHIPTRREHESMNLGQAVAVCLYELARDEAASEVSAPATALASGEELNRISDFLIEAATLSGYTPPQIEESSHNKIRRMVRRLQLQARDVPMWLGMLRQLLWKMKRE